MDRPEWVDVHPTTGELYITMTNNSSRRAAPTGTQTGVDAANPRAYIDVRGGTTTQSGNVNGHIVRFKDANPEATSFNWDVYLFGAEASAVAITAAAGAKANTTGNSAGVSGGKNDAKTVGAYHKGMATFTVVKGGLMYEAAVSGQKFTFKKKG